MEYPQCKSLLKQGNDCFNDKQWSQAELFYSEAYNILAYGYQNDLLSADILMAWICTCHNLSLLYESSGNLELSLKFLKVPHDYLIAITKSTMLNEDVKLIAIKGLSLTVPPLKFFANKHSICDTCKEKLSAVSLLIEQKSSLIH